MPSVQNTFAFILLVYVISGLANRNPAESSIPDLRRDDQGNAPYNLKRFRTLARLFLAHTPPSVRWSRKPVAVSRRAAVMVPILALTLSHPTFAATGPDRSTMDVISSQTPLTKEKQDQFVELASGLKYKDLQIGKGNKVQSGDTVSVQYTGRLLNLNGKKFMSTKDKAVEQGGLPDPYTFVVGAKTAIPGLEELVLGMAKGGVRRGVIPPALGYDTAISLGPTPDNLQDLQALSSVVKNPSRDATLLLDIRLERIRSRNGA